MLPYELFGPPFEPITIIAFFDHACAGRPIRPLEAATPFTLSHHHASLDPVDWYVIV